MSNIIGTVRAVAGSALEKGQNLLDARIPPKKRQDIFNKTWAFVEMNPKLSAFILINLLCSSLPIALFGTFMGTVFACALIWALSTVAFCFTLALAFLVPTLIVTTITATSIWCFGMLAYSLFDRARVATSRPNRRQVTAPSTGHHHIPEQVSRTDIFSDFSDPTTVNGNGHANSAPHASESGNRKKSFDSDHTVSTSYTSTSEDKRPSGVPIETILEEKNEEDGALHTKNGNGESGVGYTGKQLPNGTSTGGTLGENVNPRDPFAVDD